MKAIKLGVEINGKELYALPLNFAQLEEMESMLDEIRDESASIATQKQGTIPIGLLKKMLAVILPAAVRYDSTITPEDLKQIPAFKIAEVFSSVLTGSGMETVGEKVPVGASAKG